MGNVSREVEILRIKIYVEGKNEQDEHLWRNGEFPQRNGNY